MIKELLPSYTDSPEAKTADHSDFYHSEHIADYTVLNKLIVSGQAMYWTVLSRVYLCSKEHQMFVLKVYPSSPKNDKVFKMEIDILRKIEYSGILPIL